MIKLTRGQYLAVDTTGKKEEAVVVIGLQVQETPHPADHVKDWTSVMRYIKRVMVGVGGCNSVGEHLHNTLKKKSLLIRPNRSVRCLHACYSHHQ